MANVADRHPVERLLDAYFERIRAVPVQAIDVEQFLRDVGLVDGNCPRNPTGGDHEDQETTDPMTGLPVKVCKHCGRQA